MSVAALRLVDTLGYQLTYTLANEQRTVKGQFDAVLLGTDFSLRLALDSTARGALRELMSMDYEMKVYEY